MQHAASENVTKILIKLSPNHTKNQLCASWDIKKFTLFHNIQSETMNLCAAIVRTHTRKIIIYILVFLLFLYMVVRKKEQNLSFSLSSGAFEYTSFYNSIIQPKSTEPQDTFAKYRSKFICEDFERKLLGLPKYVSDRIGNTSCPDCIFFTCRNVLFYNDTRFHWKVRNFMNKQAPMPEYKDIDVLNEVKDCKKFIIDRGFVTVDNPDDDFSIAYNILMHQNAEQAVRLLKAIYRY